MPETRQSRRALRGVTLANAQVRDIPGSKTSRRAARRRWRIVQHRPESQIEPTGAGAARRQCARRRSATRPRATANIRAAAPRSKSPTKRSSRAVGHAADDRAQLRCEQAELPKTYRSRSFRDARGDVELFDGGSPTAKSPGDGASKAKDQLQAVEQRVDLEVRQALPVRAGAARNSRNADAAGEVCASAGYDSVNVEHVAQAIAAP